MLPDHCKTNPAPRHGLTLVELVVVMAIMGLLAALLMPVVNTARETARAMSCRNNLKQVSLAVQAYELHHGVYPPTFQLKPGRLQRGSWSIHGRILPFLEYEHAHSMIDLSRDWHTQQDSGMPELRVPMYHCPSDPRAVVRLKDFSRYVQPTSYGFNFGTWFIYDPLTGATGDGAFRVQRATRAASFGDGLSQTLCAAEVKAFTPYVRNTHDPGPYPPTSPAHFRGLSGQAKMSLDGGRNTGHTVWCDGRVHHTGFTTAFAPNTRVAYEYGGQVFDIDFNSQQEGRHLEKPTYAAVTARSYHRGSVNCVFMDGSVRAIANQVDRRVWRAMGTRNRGSVEPVVSAAP